MGKSEIFRHVSWFSKIGSFIKKGELIATISDPYGKVEHKMKAPHDGYVINVNDAPIVYQGDAIFHVSTHFRIRKLTIIMFLLVFQL